MSTTYHKIPNVYDRETTGQNRIIEGKFSSPALAFLADYPIWDLTEKIDGMNIRVIWDGYFAEVRGRTDKAQLPPPVADLLSRTFLTKDAECLFEQFFHETPTVLYGECYGGRVQGAGPLYGELSFALFDIRRQESSWSTREEVAAVARAFGVGSAPLLRTGSTLHEAVEYVRTRPMSWLSMDAPMEGVVARCGIDLFTTHGARLICKIKTRDIKPRDTKENA